ncbi:large conductance mechanosensitive channel [Mobilisporobacter senegalensis]|uniref:Large-conductance mechanosensitive channel n=1 Tax=Mobilisporobacter senegalensis TaxID=1329262 RepID=A0A3N1XZZ0_9FIRM|nr:large conductance mechanosensitive channel protein MscL [Mobilisporobacter senegalensis]ROR30517.1 large conductance mechanosensitive channel [Mobilisporobacter senegalensis]
MSHNKKGFIQEFKTFAMRGNVIDLAVGVIIGAAFQKIVTSFVNDLIMPIIGLITGGENFNEQFLILKIPENVDRTAVTSIDIAQKLGVTTFNYGSFIGTIIDFLIVAFVIFIMVKGINKMTLSSKKEEVAEAQGTKKCPFCQSEIAAKANRCPYCTSNIE